MGKSLYKDMLTKASYIKPSGNHLRRLNVLVGMICSCMKTKSSKFLVFSNVSDTCAKPPGFRLFVPLKITLDIWSSRNSLLFCSPSTHRIASTTFDFPDPFGPTIPITSSEKLITVSFAKLLNPFISRLFNRIACKDKKRGDGVIG